MPIVSLLHGLVCCPVGGERLIRLGLASFDDVKEKIKVEKTFQPRKEYAAVYEKSFKVYKKLYKQNKKLFAAMNRPE